MSLVLLPATLRDTTNRKNRVYKNSHPGDEAVTLVVVLSERSRWADVERPWVVSRVVNYYVRSDWCRNPVQIADRYFLGRLCRISFPLVVFLIKYVIQTRNVRY